MGQIEEAADQRDWPAVHQLAQDVLQLDPENSDALGYLAAAERTPGSAISTAFSVTLKPNPTAEIPIVKPVAA